MIEEAGLLSRLAARLQEMAAQGNTASYGGLAADLNIPGPGSIAKLAQALETLMEADAALGRPMRAALCEARLGGGRPAPGFFEKAVALGFDVSDPDRFVKNNRERLFEKS